MIVLVVILLVLAVIVAATAGAWLQRRATTARLGRLLAEVDDAPVVPGRASALDATFARLAEVVGVAGRRSADAISSAHRLTAALDAIPQGVVVCDDERREVFRNQAALAFAGARHGEALVERAVGEQLALSLAGSPGQRELELFGPPHRTLMITTMVLGRDEGGSGALAVVDDLSERRRLDAIRRDFVANISHELKTPVGAVGLLAETLAGEDDPAVVRRLAARMQAEAIRVGGIIDDLLDLTRIESDPATLGEPVPLEVVVTEAVERVVPLADARGIVIAAEPISSRQTVIGDRRQLVAALSNLLDNAVKYSDDDSKVELRCTSDGTWVRMTVRDHGIGIPARDLGRVFERFYRVDRARSRETGGTGLGLAIVRHIVGNHRGEVHVESREGEGSTFTLTLPAGPGPFVITSDVG